MLTHDIRAPPRRGIIPVTDPSVPDAQQGTPHRPVAQPVREASTAKGHYSPFRPRRE